MRKLLRHKLEVRVGLIIVAVSIRTWCLQIPVSKRVEL
jgi:hypothetical protein